MKKKIDFPTNIHLIEGDILTKDLKKNSFDMIFALDVLEHINDLEPYITLFDSLLTQEGAVIISGPTENVFYKVGRKIAGNRFTGDYHVKNIADIKDLFKKQMKVDSIKKLVLPVVLFEIFSAKKKLIKRQTTSLKNLKENLTTVFSN